MASMAISLHLKPKPSSLNPTLIRFFSSSSKPPDLTPDNNPSPSPDPTPNDNPSPSQSQSEDSFSSFFSDVKSKLNQQPPPPQSPSSNADIRRKLAQFHPKSTQSSPPPSSSQPFSLQGLYQKRERVSFDAIRENLKKFAPDNKRSDSLWRLREGFNRDPKSAAIGGSGVLPAAIFGREMKDRVAGESPEMRKTTQLFMKSYEPDELGKRLTELRPKNLKEFSIKELSERLVKVREIEEAENATNGRGIVMSDLRNSLRSIEMKEKNKHIQRLDALSHLGRTETFMLSPPKEHLVEKYFHPDNMSSAEKLKIELQKVRDEFKMSETDCGSARVQVAQLTTKIKHLTTALHKKDKHSRKGLQEMVQRRKKLLKYLRRTDWDSYCLVLSKLGLRDRPDLKIK